jgi:hypothetical protein
VKQNLQTMEGAETVTLDTKTNRSHCSPKNRRLRHVAHPVDVPLLQGGCAQHVCRPRFSGNKRAQSAIRREGIPLDQPEHLGRSYSA